MCIEHYGKRKRKQKRKKERKEKKKRKQSTEKERDILIHNTHASPTAMYMYVSYCLPCLPSLLCLPCVSIVPSVSPVPLLSLVSFLLSPTSLLYFPLLSPPSLLFQVFSFLSPLSRTHVYCLSLCPLSHCLLCLPGLPRLLSLSCLPSSLTPHE